jgi:hypothetical protein
MEPHLGRIGRWPNLRRSIPASTRIQHHEKALEFPERVQLLDRHTGTA